MAAPSIYKRGYGGFLTRVLSFHVHVGYISNFQGLRPLLRCLTFYAILSLSRRSASRMSRTRSRVLSKSDMKQIGIYLSEEINQNSRLTRLRLTKDQREDKVEDPDRK